MYVLQHVWCKIVYNRLNGTKVMAYSRKDAIKRLKHKK